MDSGYDMLESMARDFRLCSAEKAIILEALRTLESAYKKQAKKDKGDAERLHKLADKCRLLHARLDGTMIGYGYAFTEI